MQANLQTLQPYLDQARELSQKFFSSSKAEQAAGKFMTASDSIGYARAASLTWVGHKIQVLAKTHLDEQQAGAPVAGAASLGLLIGMVVGRYLIIAILIADTVKVIIDGFNACVDYFKPNNNNNDKLQTAKELVLEDINLIAQDGLRLVAVNINIAGLILLGLFDRKAVREHLANTDLPHQIFIGFKVILPSDRYAAQETPTPTPTPPTTSETVEVQS